MKNTMNARDLFEYIGYDFYENAQVIEYSHYHHFDRYIIFNKERKEIKIVNEDKISLSRLKAINKQVEELGWLDE